MAELLLELFSEEIPARMQRRAAEDLKRLVLERVKEARLDWDAARAFVTPRRLTLVVDGLPAKQPDISEERRGPRVGAPDKAVDGFLRGNGLTRDALVERETPKGSFYFAVVEQAGRATADVLVDVVSGAIAAMGWPKSMRWGGNDVRWVRPLHSILCLFDGATVPARFGHITAGGVTRGHRFMAPDEIEVRGFDDYSSKLGAADVMLDADARRRLILRDAEALCAEAGLTLRRDDALLDEVTGLVEWPVVMMGRIDEAFMAVPDEALISAMRTHQKYFVADDKAGKLAPRFVMVANIAASDGGKAIVNGNERVLRARLADARFFWDNDRKTPLADRIEGLESLVFHARLGSVAEKVARLESLAMTLAGYMPGADAALAERAARLSKADLVTDMVDEFPELQGIMGRYYALHDDEDAAVAEAIGDHYAPQGPGDRAPSAPVSVALALADKLDTLVGFFAIDEKPTGSKDPFALRRAALGVLRLLLENEVRVPLRPVIEKAAAAYGPELAAIDRDTLFDDLMGFLADRLKVLLRDQGVRHDLVAAVFAGVKDDDIVRLIARVRALQTFVDGEDGANLIAAYRRASNIVRIEEKKDGVRYHGEAATALLEQDEERALHDGLRDAGKRIADALEAEDFQGAMTALAALRGPVDAFFDEVTVNCDAPDVRRNRLMLLSEIRAALGSIADFSKIEG